MFVRSPNEDVDEDQPLSADRHAELLIRFDRNGEVRVDWLCSADAEQNQRLLFDSTRDTLLAALSAGRIDLETVTGGGTERSGYQHFGQCPPTESTSRVLSD